MRTRSELPHDLKSRALRPAPCNENLCVATGGDRVRCGFENFTNAESAYGRHAGPVGQLAQRDPDYAAKELLAELGARFSAPVSRSRPTRTPASLAIPPP